MTVTTTRVMMTTASIDPVILMNYWKMKMLWSYFAVNFNLWTTMTMNRFFFTIDVKILLEEEISYLRQAVMTTIHESYKITDTVATTFKHYISYNSNCTYYFETLFVGLVVPQS
mmetsp:Transcript_29708/g.71943  ORF Transcript_29708/g.71943 Transcript_29708/m.71943 type:complete len:114 (+) Transcript_29708:953-1294(+)